MWGGNVLISSTEIDIYFWFKGGEMLCLKNRKGILSAK
jgi:hypothetical protein